MDRPTAGKTIQLGRGLILANRRVATEAIGLRWHTGPIACQPAFQPRLPLTFLIEQLTLQHLFTQGLGLLELLETLLGSRLQLLRGLTITSLIQGQRRIAGVVGCY